MRVTISCRYCIAFEVMLLFLVSDSFGMAIWIYVIGANFTGDKKMLSPKAKNARLCVEMFVGILSWDMM